MTDLTIANLAGLLQTLADAKTQADVQSSGITALEQAGKLLSKTMDDIQKKTDLAKTEIDADKKAVAEIDTNFPNNPSYQSQRAAVGTEFTNFTKDGDPTKGTLDCANDSLGLVKGRLDKADADVKLAKITLQQQQNLLAEKKQTLSDAQDAFANLAKNIQDTLDKLGKARAAATGAIGKVQSLDALIYQQQIKYWQTKLEVLIGTNTTPPTDTTAPLWASFTTALNAYDAQATVVSEKQVDLGKKQDTLADTKTCYENRLKTFFDDVKQKVKAEDVITPALSAH